LPPGTRRVTRRVLVTGGAGYIGSVVVEQLMAAGVGGVVLDDLSRGHGGAIPPGVGFVPGGGGGAAPPRRRVAGGAIGAGVALGRRPAVDVFGTDYSTPDGTAVRDYVHVADIADAHLRALDATVAGAAAVNLGTGTGYSVRDVVQAAEAVTGRRIATTPRPR